MSKIRINELARQLEVKSREVIDKLHELGVTEALTHSSSIDDDMADKLRRYFGGDTSVLAAPPPSPPRETRGSRTTDEVAPAPRAEDSSRQMRLDDLAFTPRRDEPIRPPIFRSVEPATEQVPQARHSDIPKRSAAGASSSPPVETTGAESKSAAAAPIAATVPGDQKSAPKEEPVADDKPRAIPLILR